MKSAIRVGSVVLADVAVIGTLYPDWSSVTAGMREPGAWIERTGADTVVGTLAATGLWVVSVWLGLALLVALSPASLASGSSPLRPPRWRPPFRRRPVRRAQ